jgi:4-amino-4-deoxy-L-arabinose transferase-like glycosyltransferase
MSSVKGKYIRIAELLILAALCFFPLCYRINDQPIRQWDESRNAVNALEMRHNHHYLVRYFEGRPEVWEVKPPFLIWLQTISLKVFGPTEMAIRFPIMLASFLTVFLLVFYFHRFQKNRYIGYITALILVSSQGYINQHIARTGDHDALLTLFTTAVILIFYEFITGTERKNYLLFALSFLFILGVLTKSVAMLFIVPGLVAATFIFRAQKKLFANSQFYLAILIFLACTITYYLVREIIQPGYLKAVWIWELFPRYTNSENRFDSGTFWIYGINFFKSRYTWWIFLLLPSVLIMPFRNKNRHNLYNYLLISSLSFFLFISTTSKAQWYDAPIFPLFAMMIALFIFNIMDELLTRLQAKPLLGKLLVFSLFILLFLYPGIKIMQKVRNSDEYYWDRERYALGYFLRDPVNMEKIRSEKVGIVFSEYYAHLLFYVEAINEKEGNHNLSFRQLEKIEPNDLLLVSEKAIMDSIKNRFNYTLIEEKKLVSLIRINDYNKPVNDFLLKIKQ